MLHTAWTEALRKLVLQEMKLQWKQMVLPFNMDGPDFQSYVGGVMKEVKAMSVELGVMK